MSAITQTVKSSQKFQISRFLSMILVWSLYRTEKICRNCITLSILKFVIKHTYTLHKSYWSIASTFLLSMNYLHVVKSTTFISKSFPTQSLTVGPFCVFRWCSGLLHSGRIWMVHFLTTWGVKFCWLACFFSYCTEHIWHCGISKSVYVFHFLIILHPNSC